jgi:hypothetical protein
MSDDTEFFEEDEPADKIWAAFERGEKGVTAEPRKGFDLPDEIDRASVVITGWRLESSKTSRPVIAPPSSDSLKVS